MKEIIRDYQKRVKSIIRKYTGADNEDIEQEVYIKAWQNLDKYEERGKFSQWIGVITANLCRDYFRSRDYTQKSSWVCDEEALENASVPPTQEVVVDEKKRQKLILKAVDDLPRDLRKIVYWFEFEEWSYEQIAKKLNIPEGTVKSRLFKARKILSEKLSFLKGE